MPALLQACVQSWQKCRGYQIIEWNETNCDITENPFVAKMYGEKRYAFVSDYFRLKALHDHGGIYLDTDVFVYRTFDRLLDCDLFLGYLYDCALGTAVIGAQRQSPLIQELLRLYTDSGMKGDIVNNGLFTEFFHDRVPGFRLNGKRATLTTPAGERVEIYGKEQFETGKILGKSYTLHFSERSWGDSKNKVPPKYKLLAARLPVNLMALRQQQKANGYMKQEGKYQGWYFEAVSNQKP